MIFVHRQIDSIFETLNFVFIQLCNTVITYFVNLYKLCVLVCVQACSVFECDVISCKMVKNVILFYSSSSDVMVL